MENLHVVELLEVYHLADEYLECALKKISLYNVSDNPRHPVICKAREFLGFNDIIHFQISKSVIESSTVAELYDWATCNDLKDFADKCVSYGATHLQVSDDSFMV